MVTIRNSVGSLCSIPIKAGALGVLSGLFVGWQILSQSVSVPDRGSSEEPRFARQLLMQSPISATALRDLGLAEDRQGLKYDALKTMDVAAALGWRDVPTQLWLAKEFLQRQQYALAAQRLDATMRTAPDPTIYYTILDQLLSEPNFADELISRLALNPQWRSQYLANVRGLSETTLLAKAAVINSLIASQTPPSREEAFPIVNALLQADQSAQARNLWLVVMKVQTGAIFDPDFRSPRFIDAGPFAWSLPTVLGANVAFGPTSGRRGELDVTSDGTASGVVARQMLILKPGMHRLYYHGDVPLPARAAYEWGVRCTAGSKLLTETSLASATSQYRFNVPNDCSTQYLDLRARASPMAAGAAARFFDVNVT